MGTLAPLAPPSAATASADHECGTCILIFVIMYTLTAAMLHNIKTIDVLKYLHGLRGKVGSIGP